MTAIRRLKFAATGTASGGILQGAGSHSGVEERALGSSVDDRGAVSQDSVLPAHFRSLPIAFPRWLTVPFSASLTSANVFSNSGLQNTGS